MIPNTKSKTDAEDLMGRGLRLTRQRQVVLEAVRDLEGHPSAEEVHRRARRELPRISLGTVYRTLGVLRDAKLVRELHFGRARGRYEKERGEHPHVVCARCGLVEDVPPSAFRDLPRRARRVTRFHVTEHRLEFLGLCPGCSRRKKARPRIPQPARRRIEAYG